MTVPIPADTAKLAAQRAAEGTILTVERLREILGGPHPARILVAQAKVAGAKTARITPEPIPRVVYGEPAQTFLPPSGGHDVLVYAVQASLGDGDWTASAAVEGAPDPSPGQMDLAWRVAELAALRKLATLDPTSGRP